MLAVDDPKWTVAHKFENGERKNGQRTAYRLSTRMTVQEIKQAMQGDWISIAPEVRPSGIKTPDGSIKPFYLTRGFTYERDDRFELTIHNLADPYGKVPLAKLLIKGHMVWQGDHAIAPGAQKVTFIADEEYEVTPLLQGFADAMNRVASKGFDKWEVDRTQSIFKKAFPPFGLAEEQIFLEYDLVYLHNDLLFWGGETRRRPRFRQRRKPTDELADTTCQKAVMSFNPLFNHPPISPPL